LLEVQRGASQGAKKNEYPNIYTSTTRDKKLRRTARSPSEVMELWAENACREEISSSAAKELLRGEAALQRERACRDAL